MSALATGPDTAAAMRKKNLVGADRAFNVFLTTTKPITQQIYYNKIICLLLFDADLRGIPLICRRLADPHLNFFERELLANFCLPR